MKQGKIKTPSWSHQHSNDDHVLFILSCGEFVYNETISGGCKWDYTGQGYDYQILAGPIFILIYTFAAIPVGIAADLYNRKVSRGCINAFVKKKIDTLMLCYLYKCNNN